MIETVSVRLDQKLVKDVDKIGQELHSDRSEAMRKLLAQAVKEWKIRRVVELLRSNEVSIGKAAEIVGITIYEMLKIAEEHGLLLGYSENDLEKDLERFNIS